MNIPKFLSSRLLLVLLAVAPSIFISAPSRADSLKITPAINPTNTTSEIKKQNIVNTNDSLRKPQTNSDIKKPVFQIKIDPIKTSVPPMHPADLPVVYGQQIRK